MKKLTEEEIKEINDGTLYDQGIFKEPFGVPDSEKRPVIYQRWEVGGMIGGDCWGGEARGYTNSEPTPEWEVLDAVLEKLAPNLTFMQFRKISKLIHSTGRSQWEYYGNSTNFGIKYIVLEELEKFCAEVNQ